ncbi:amidase [Pelagicoccus albus]|uniref:Amidase n=1 Tax=Pelagicoccus albus TaxID=415222 RepID=A0A7X1B7V5_9BACT|nr:amidase [Pelagicoccus albus]MBC2607285.1 amidase [Pelagicoccus albus]
MTSDLFCRSAFRFFNRSLLAAFIWAVATVSPTWGQVEQEVEPALSAESIASAAEVLGLSYDEAELELMREDVSGRLSDYERIRAIALDNAIPPALVFNPLPEGFVMPSGPSELSWVQSEEVLVPDDNNELAFYTVAELGELLRTRKITSLELTEFFLDRLKKHDPALQCVITLTEERALAQASRADAEIAAGDYRGPLHGIPYGAKDLLAVPGYPTTWGAKPFEHQEREELATVIEKLDEAGAVLVAKLTMGALAWGDVWYGGKTKNPWDLEQGSSGSSAGPASATAAGLVPFAIGTETWGSIVSPSNRCGVTGLRPTFGRVSRYGAMALSWSMDKIGPMARSVEDCALVFSVIQGVDTKDASTFEAPFSYSDDPIDLSKVRFGFVEAEFEKEREGKEQDLATLDKLRELGAKFEAVTLPSSLPTRALSLIFTVEAATAFDELTLSNQDDELVRQTENAYPNVFRAARLIPAVEYLKANRLRQVLIQEMDTLMQEIDVLVSPSFGSDQLLMTNLTGHPCVVLPNGFDESGHPKSITFVGKLFDEETLLSVAAAYQESTDFHQKHPAPFLD